MHGNGQRAGAAAGARAPTAAAAAALCWCLVLACAVSAQAAASGVAEPDYTVYLKKDDLLKKVEELVQAHPDTMKLEMRHAKDGNYSADLTVITVEPGGLSPTHTNKARLLWDFGEHGREFITSEVGLRLLQVLQDDAVLGTLLGSSRRVARLKAILKHTVIKVVPMENVNGRSLVESGRLCERKNGRGVDTNRNWDIDWGKKEKDYDPNEEYPGRAPHSEPEVQILLALAKELQPHVWLNVHSGMYALFTPYDHKPHTPNTPNGRAALRMMNRVQQLSCPQCVVGSGGHSVGYLAHGTGTDYMYEKLGVPMSFTWEIYGDSTASFEDCFRMFNPLGKAQFEEVVGLWTKALLQLLELLPSHPATWPLFKAAGLEASPEDDAAVADDGAAPPAAGTSPAAAGGSEQEPAAEQQPDAAASAAGQESGGGVAVDMGEEAEKIAAEEAARDGDMQPDEEGSLWQKKQPIEEEPPIAQGAAGEASPAVASPAVPSPVAAVPSPSPAAAVPSPAAAVPSPAAEPSPSPAAAVPSPAAAVPSPAAAVPSPAATSDVAAGTAKQAEEQPSQQQPEQQQPELVVQQQKQQQQEEQEEARSIRIQPLADGSSSSRLIRSNHLLPLLVGVGGLVGLACYFSRSRHAPAGPQYNKLTRML